MEFVSFGCAFKDLKFERKLDASASQAQILQLLVEARNILSHRMFDYAPFDCARFKEKIPVTRAKNSVELAKQLSGTSVQKIIQVAGGLVEREEYLDGKKRADRAELLPCFYLRESWFRKPVEPEPEGNPASGEVRLAADFKNWRMVKKQKLDVPKKEVLVGLSSMYASISNKIPSIACSDADGLEEHVSKLFSVFSERKSFGKLPLMLSAFPEEKVGSELKQFATDAASLDALVDWFYFKLFEYSGYGPVPLASQLNGIYPELKIPKPKGNFGGKKKKK